MPETVVIGGSGPSLLRTDPRRIPANARIVRVNNFFLETQYHLGSVVDRVYFSADKRALRFYLATLRDVIAGGGYDIRSTASHHEAAPKANPPLPFELIRVRDRHLSALIEQYRRDCGAKPTSGMMAVVAEVERGATDLLLAGIDFYASEKYAYPPPRQLLRILHPNLDQQGHDSAFHSIELDIAVLNYLVDQGIDIRLAHEHPAPGGPQFDPAPIRADGDHLVVDRAKTPGVSDWVRFTGLSSIDTLVAARWIRRRAGRSRRRG